VEAQVQRQHIRGTYPLAIAAALSAALMAGAGVGYALGTAISTRDAGRIDVAPAQLTVAAQTSRSTHDDWAFEAATVNEQVAPASRSTGDNWAFDSAQITPAINGRDLTSRSLGGVQSAHAEQSEAAMDLSDGVPDLIGFGPR
jgi:hypothetical protein